MGRVIEGLIFAFNVARREEKMLAPAGLIEPPSHYAFAKWVHGCRTPNHGAPPGAPNPMRLRKHHAWKPPEERGFIIRSAPR